MALNRMGVEVFDGTRPPAPVTVPALSCLKVPVVDDGAERREVAAQFAEHRIVAKGREAWAAINKAESFDGWKAIGAALAVGKAHALKVTGANQAWGQHYSREFSLWVRQHGFDKMPAATRSVAVELHENAEAITAWRDTLPERQRKRLVHPLSVTRRWRASRAHGNGKCPQDLRRDAKAAWQRFRSCLEGLPADEARTLWQSVADEATTHVAPGEIFLPASGGVGAKEGGLRSPWCFSSSV